MSARASGTASGSGFELDMMRAFRTFFEDLRAAESVASEAGPQVQPPPNGVRGEDNANTGHGGDGADGSGPPQHGEATAADDHVRRMLVAAFERFSRDTRRIFPRTAADAAEDAAFAAAVFADERFIRLEWAGRSAWLDRPLEVELFNTRVGGQRIFQRIEGLGGGSGERALARLYLAMLNLGFGGRYDPESPDDAEALDDYRERLFKLLSGRSPEPTTAADGVVDTGRPAQSLGSVRYLPYVRPWITAMVVVVLLFLAANHAIWRVHTMDLADRVARLTRDMGY